MGSLRNPVGPLPSSIYWRRRGAFLVVLLALAGLAAWLFAGGGGRSDGSSGGPDGKNPAPSITPGPSGSGPAIDDPPGEGGSGTGGSSDGASSGGTSGADAGGTSGAGGEGDGADGGSGDGGGAADGGPGSSGSGSGSSGKGWTSSVNRLPGDTSLAACGRSDVRMSLRSVRKSYEDDEKPVLRLTVTNTSGSDCRIDLGPRAAVLKITKANADDDETYWSSADCPDSGALLFRVPKDGEITYEVEWDRKPSDADKCEVAPKGSAGAGTYLVVAKSGATSSPLQATFTLTSD
ncbi:hypothetical protein [Streptomyces sp. NPDC056600]|uniref:hypothetical protein n=1 Tax=Streptomyces sp. NPDC056600 TaxID=3345874 RepID=UPI003682D2DA